MPPTQIWRHRFSDSVFRLDTHQEYHGCHPELLPQARKGPPGRRGEVLRPAHKLQEQLLSCYV